MSSTDKPPISNQASKATGSLLRGGPHWQPTAGSRANADRHGIIAVWPSPGGGDDMLSGRFRVLLQRGRAFRVSAMAGTELTQLQLEVARIDSMLKDLDAVYVYDRNIILESCASLRIIVDVNFVQRELIGAPGGKYTRLGFFAEVAAGPGVNGDCCLRHFLLTGFGISNTQLGSNAGDDLRFRAVDFNRDRTLRLLERGELAL